MQKFISIAASLLTLIAFGQHNDACKKGTCKALKDFSGQKYVLQTLGQEVDKDFDPFFISYAKMKYNITITGTDCIVWPDRVCYDKTMRKKVLEKFGSDIEEKIKDGALKKFRQSRKYILQIKPKIDTGFVFTSAQKNPAYPGGELALRGFLRTNINELSRNYWSVIVGFIVEKDGSISNVSIHGKDNTEITSEINRLLTLMPKWIPARYYDEAVRFRMSISISSKKEMELIDEDRAKK